MYFLVSENYVYIIIVIFNMICMQQFNFFLNYIFLAL